MPTDLTALRSRVAFLVGDSSSGSQTDRDRAINDFYLDVAIRAWWRLRSSDYTAASSPALTAGTTTYNAPSDFDSAHRLYYRDSGQMRDVPLLGDSEWLERSTTQTTDAGEPEIARVIHSGSAIRLELSPAPSQAWITNTGTLTLAYYIVLTRLSGATDEPLVPENLRHHLGYGAAWLYALGQSDWNLVKALQPRAELARAEILRQDVTRTGRARQMRPTYNYTGTKSSHRGDRYQAA